MKPILEWPTPEEEQRLLAQLANEVRTGREELAARFLPLLMNFLASIFPHVAPELRDEAADRAILDFLLIPSRFDPTRSRLSVYLRMAARRDLANLLTREQGQPRGISLDSVAEPVDCRNPSTEDSDLSWEHPRWVEELARLNPTERVAFDLIREGTRETAIFAQRLQLTELNDEQQTRTVKRLRDRLMKRLVRAVEEVS
jgi:RNA polymerase sigma factor (sigma-70 family)